MDSAKLLEGVRSEGMNMVQELLNVSRLACILTEHD